MRLNNYAQRWFCILDPIVHPFPPILKLYSLKLVLI